MLKKIVWFTLLCFCTTASVIKAQEVTLNIDSNQALLMSNFSDSLKVYSLKDTVSPSLLRIPDSITLKALKESISLGYGYPVFNLSSAINSFKSKDASNLAVQKGDLLVKGDVWILITIVSLILIFAILNQTFSKQLVAIIQSFFSNRALSNLNKEDNLFTSWPFLILFVQFGFILGLFVYLGAQFRALIDVQAGFQYYLTISLLIIAFYGFKIVIVKIFGFIFNIQKATGEYVSILYLSYFNASMLFIPLVLAFALTPLKFGAFYITLAAILLVFIFVFQFIRAGINILSNYRFPKVYLFLYFCTLEICPILILIKAIGF